ncbi:MAG: hypothetical protein HKN60_09965 [Rhizobiales bacterium]|nr:hypothetical protein [Hyphomicrobiales bacterium]
MHERIAGQLARDVAPEVREFARHLAQAPGAQAVLFYGSNLRTGSLEGVLDYYVLLDGEAERGVWPRVSYHEREIAGHPLRAKVATMSMAKFTEAAAGELLDTTIWARFVQPCALVWHAGSNGVEATSGAITAASCTAARLAAVLGPQRGGEDDFWMALFEATYRAEFRIETASRARSILDLNRGHFAGLLPVALEAAGIPFEQIDDRIAPQIDQAERSRIRRWWARRRRMGKPINLLRLLRAARTFEGASHYAAWKIERHTGVPVEITPFREKHPVLAAPGVMLSVWRKRKKVRQ